MAIACCVILGVLGSSIVITAVDATKHGAWWRVTAKLCVRHCSTCMLVYWAALCCLGSSDRLVVQLLLWHIRPQS